MKAKFFWLATTLNCIYYDLGGFRASCRPTLRRSSRGWRLGWPVPGLSAHVCLPLGFFILFLSYFPHPSAYFSCIGGMASKKNSS